MNQEKRLKCAIVGCGYIAKNAYAPILKRTPGVDVVALCDPNLNAAEDLAKSFRIPNIYADFSSVLKQERLDFVNICSPTQTHFAFTSQALKNQIHVLQEKPIALNVSEADQMLSLARENHVRFCVVHNLLYNPPMQRAMALIASGVLGDLLSVDVKIFDRPTGPISRPNHWCHHATGGRLLDLSEQAIYLIIKLLGQVKSVKAVARKVSPWAWVQRDEMRILLEAEKGIGTIEVSCNAPAISHIMEIRGTKKTLLLNSIFMTLVSYHSVREARLRDFAVENVRWAAQLVGGSLSGIVRGRLGHRVYRDGHRRIISDFIRSLTDDVDLLSTPEDSRESLRVFQEAWSQVAS